MYEHKNARRYTKDELASSLNDFGKKFKRLPSQREAEKFICANTTIDNHFGTYSKFVHYTLKKYPKLNELVTVPKYTVIKKYAELAQKLGKFPSKSEFETLINEEQYKKIFGTMANLKSAALENFPELGAAKKLSEDLKILVFDIETFSMTVEAWGLRDQNFGLNQVVEDGYVVAWAAKWLNDPPSKVMYMDQSKVKTKSDNKKLIQEIVKLLDQADIVVSQNGIKFDSKTINAEIEYHDLDKPSSYRHHDLYRIAKKYLNLPSYKLEYMSNKYNKKYKKLKHKKYPGHDLWRECRKGNQSAWKEMRRYNIHDVLATEELYNRFKKWFFRKYS